MNLQGRYEIGLALNAAGDDVERLRPLEMVA